MLNTSISFRMLALLILGFMFLPFLLESQAIGEETTPSEIVLISAPATAQEGDLINDPQIIAINGITLSEPIPSVVTKTWMEPWGGCYMPVPGTHAIASTSKEGYQWIGSNSIYFQTNFTLPEGFTNPALSFTATADDQVDVLLNGVGIGTIIDGGTYLCDPPSSFTISRSGAFKAGENIVELRLINHNAPQTLSLSYKLVVSFTPPAVTDVTIDIKPGSYPNSINRKNHGNIPVAVLSDSTFDALTLDLGTVLFAGSSPLPIGETPEDVNGDGLLDVVLHFETQSLDLQSGYMEACLAGKTVANGDIRGCDSVHIVK